MFRYEIFPIDWFPGTMSLFEYLNQESLKEDGESLSLQERNLFFSRVLSNLASEMSKMETWEGDVNGSISVFSVPCEGNMEVGFVWKQSNNGTTFVISPIKLPHLDEISCK